MPELKKGTYCFTFHESDRPVGTDNDDAGSNAIVDALTRARLAETRCDYEDERHDGDPSHLYMTDTQIARLVRIISQDSDMDYLMTLAVELTICGVLVMTALVIATL